MITAEEFLKLTYITDSKGNYVTFNFEKVCELMQEYARQCCLETAKNTRHKAIEIFNNTFSFMDTSDDLNFSACERDIMNISNQDVLPKFE